MRLRCAMFAVLALAGCESLRGDRPTPVVALRPSNPMVVSEPVAVLVALANAEAAEDPPADSLTLFADCLARGDEPAACRHLDEYLREHPDQPLFRVQLADLLLKVGQPTRARAQLERFTADARECGKPLFPQRVAAHTQLMDLAAQDDDSFGESLHRGLGLLVLVEQQDAAPDRDDTFREEVLCKALKALNEAKRLEPDDVHVHLALADAFAKMGNSRAAEVERRAARPAVHPGSLTASEQRWLALPSSR